MRRIRIGLLVLLWCATEAAAHSPTAVPDDDEIRRILLERVDVQKQSVGIVVGVIDRQGRRIVAYGSPDKGDPRRLDGNTLFEIGSTTEVYTALLAADMARRGELKLGDPKMPERNELQITSLDLATPTSGLARLPTNMRSRAPMNPHADTEDQLFSFLSSYEIPRDIGVRYEYSNLDFDLLAQALARRAGTSYESLVVSRICAPLHMDNTSVLYSSANDLLTLLAAMMDYTHNPLSAAQKIALSRT